MAFKWYKWGGRTTEMEMSPVKIDENNYSQPQKETKRALFAHPLPSLVVSIKFNSEIF